MTFSWRLLCYKNLFTCSGSCFTKNRPEKNTRHYLGDDYNRVSKKDPSHSELFFFYLQRRPWGDFSCPFEGRQGRPPPECVNAHPDVPGAVAAIHIQTRRCSWTWSWVGSLRAGSNGFNDANSGDKFCHHGCQFAKFHQGKCALKDNANCGAKKPPKCDAWKVVHLWESTKVWLNGSHLGTWHIYQMMSVLFKDDLVLSSARTKSISDTSSFVQ